MRNSFRRGFRCQEYGYYRTAIVAYRRVTPDDAAYHLARVGVIYCLYCLGRYLEAKEEARGFIRDVSIPDLKGGTLWWTFLDENPYLLLACSCWKLGERDEAQHWFDTFRRGGFAGSREYWDRYCELAADARDDAEDIELLGWLWHCDAQSVKSRLQSMRPEAEEIRAEREAALQAMRRRVRNGDLALEEPLRRTEEGVKALKRSRDLLKEAEKHIEALVKDAERNRRVEPIEAEEEEV